MDRLCRSITLLVLLLLLFYQPVHSNNGQQYEYLILCPDALEQIVIPYATSLSKIGIRTRIIPYQVGEFEDMEIVKEVIKREFLLYKIEYVTLIGSTTKDETHQYVIPMKQYLSEYEDQNLICYSDMVYGSILDPEGTLDLCIGRIPFEKPDLIIPYLENMETFWKEAQSQEKNILLTGSWLWMQHCYDWMCLLYADDRFPFEQPPFQTINFHPRESIDKADLLEQIVPLYFPEEYSIYRLYELEGLKASNRKYFADDSLTEENLIKYYNETDPDIVLLSGALDDSIGKMKLTPSMYRKIWKEDINQDQRPNYGEMGYPSYMTDKSVERLKSEAHPIVISDASFLLDPDIHSIGKTMLEQGAIGIIGNTGYGVTTYVKNGGDFYENGPYSSIFLESLLLKSLRMGFPIGTAFKEMQNTNLRMHNKTWSHYSMNLFGDPLIGFYNLPLELKKTVVKTDPLDGELYFEGNRIHIQFNYTFIKTKKDLQSVKESILIADLLTNLNYSYTPAWDQPTRTLTLNITNPLPPDSWFLLDISGTRKVSFHTKPIEEKVFFDLPATGKILTAEFGWKDGVPDHVVSVTEKLNEFIQQGNLEILINQESFVTLPNQKNWLYLSWQDTRNTLFQEQIPEGTSLRFISDDPEKEEALTANLNSLLAKYYNNANCLGKPVYEDKTRTINYDWGIKKPNAFVNQDHFSVYWTGLYEFVEGYYRFTTQSDDGLVIMVDGEKIVDQWFTQTRREKVKRLHIKEGKHLIEIYYYDHTGPAGVEVKWERE